VTGGQANDLGFPTRLKVWNKELEGPGREATEREQQSVGKRGKITRKLNRNFGVDSAFPQVEMPRSGESHADGAFTRRCAARRHELVVVIDQPAAKSLRKQRHPGSAKGKLIIRSEDEQHLQDFRDYMP